MLMNCRRIPVDRARLRPMKSMRKKAQSKLEMNFTRPKIAVAKSFSLSPVVPLYGLSEIYVSVVNLIMILHHGKVLRCVYSNADGARPLAEDLGHESEHNPI